MGTVQTAQSQKLHYFPLNFARFSQSSAATISRLETVVQQSTRKKGSRLIALYRETVGSVSQVRPPLHIDSPWSRSRCDGCRGNFLLLCHVARIDREPSMFCDPPRQYGSCHSLSRRDISAQDRGKMPTRTPSAISG